jgi:hypothetical protein
LADLHASFVNAAWQGIALLIPPKRVVAQVT